MDKITIAQTTRTKLYSSSHKSIPGNKVFYKENEIKVKLRIAGSLKSLENRNKLRELMEQNSHFHLLSSEELRNPHPILSAIQSFVKVLESLNLKEIKQSILRVANG